MEHVKWVPCIRGTLNDLLLPVSRVRHSHKSLGVKKILCRGVMISWAKTFLFGGSLPSLPYSMVILQEEFLKEIRQIRENNSWLLHWDSKEEFLMLCMHREQLSFGNINCCPGVLEWSLLSHGCLQQVPSHFWGSLLCSGWRTRCRHCSGHGDSHAGTLGCAVPRQLCLRTFWAMAKWANSDNLQPRETAELPTPKCYEKHMKAVKQIVFWRVGII